MNKISSGLFLSLFLLGVLSGCATSTDEGTSSSAPSFGDKFEIASLLFIVDDLASAEDVLAAADAITYLEEQDRNVDNSVILDTEIEIEDLEGRFFVVVRNLEFSVILPDDADTEQVLTAADVVTHVNEEYGATADIILYSDATINDLS